MSSDQSEERGAAKRRSRPTVLLAAAAAVAAAGLAAAQSPVIRGAVTYEGGGVIPKGRLEVYLEDPAGLQRPAAETRLESDGGSKAIAFSLPPPADSAGPPGWRIVARLERAADDWLVARGSARFEPGTPADVTLRPVVY